MEINDNSRNKKNLLITARTHPYESAGSFNVEGIIAGMINGRGKSILKGCSIYIIPMVCPDGVYNGLCRLNSVNAPDLSRIIDENDILSKAYLQLLDNIRPAIFLEFHNWMIKDYDGIFYLPWRDTYILKTELQRRINVDKQKKWSVGVNNILFKCRPEGLKKYANDNYRTKCMTIEYSWYGRSTEDMKRLGVQTLESLSRII